uniref:Uncharacterized protein n=1 Tax=Sphaerodactylus townsendi TaxID=933632 RepID=A0ACB8GBJ0_9SAUR
MPPGNLTTGGNGSGAPPEPSEGRLASPARALFVVRCVIPSLYLLIMLVGLLGNVTLLRIFAGQSARRSVPNIFISSLAAGDLLLLLTCVPVDASRFFLQDWLFGALGCKLLPAIQLTSVGVSVFTLTALSADSLLSKKLPHGTFSLLGEEAEVLLERHYAVFLYHLSCDSDWVMWLE